MTKQKMSGTDGCLLQIGIIWLAMGATMSLPGLFFSFMGPNLVLIAIGIIPPIFIFYIVYSHRQRDIGIERGTRAPTVATGFVIPPNTPPHRMKPLRENEVV